MATFAGHSRPHLAATSRLAPLPWSVAAAGIGLVLLGWLGIARSDELAAGSGYYPRQQLVWAVVAVAAVYATTFTSYRTLGRWAYALFAAAVGLLVLVYFFPAVHGVHRWIRLFGLSVQPSELAKTAYVVALARYLMERENYRQFAGLLAPLLLTLVPVVLVLREPDLGTSLVFIPVLFVMLYIAGARTKHLLLLAGCGVLLLPVLWTQMSREQRSRVTSLFEQTTPGKRPSADGYQLHQAKQLLALGGVQGSYFADEANDDRAAYHLPEAHTDFIFVVLGERYGWAGLTTLLALYSWLVWRAAVIAEATREPFGRLLAAGIGALFAVQVLINTGMTVGLLPVTGLSLPLVSYGGSGLLAHALALGLLLNIASRPSYEVSREPFRFV